MGLQQQQQRWKRKRRNSLLMANWNFREPRAGGETRDYQWGDTSKGKGAEK